MNDYDEIKMVFFSQKNDCQIKMYITIIESTRF